MFSLICSRPFATGSHLFAKDRGVFADSWGFVGFCVDEWGRAGTIKPMVRIAATHTVRVRHATRLKLEAIASQRRFGTMTECVDAIADDFMAAQGIQMPDAQQNTDRPSSFRDDQPNASRPAISDRPVSAGECNHAESPGKGESTFSSSPVTATKR